MDRDVVSNNDNQFLREANQKMMKKKRRISKTPALPVEKSKISGVTPKKSQKNKIKGNKHSVEYDDDYEGGSPSKRKSLKNKAKVAFPDHEDDSNSAHRHRNPQSKKSTS